MTVSLAIIGLGRWGQSLVDAVDGSDTVRFTAAVTRTPSRVADYCSRKSLALTDDYQRILQDDTVDAVVIATPHSLHFEQIMAAASAGKHVFCEKPFTLTAAEAHVALEALSDLGLKVAIGHNRRFAPNTVALKKALDSHSLGQPIHIDGHFNADLSHNADKWRNSRTESPAGGMTSLGIHVIDAFVHLFGRVANVNVQSRRIAIGLDIDDSTLVRLNFENGCTGHLTTIAATSSLWQIRVFGTGGWAECTDLDRYVFNPSDGDCQSSEFSGYEYPGSETMKTALEAFAADIRHEGPYPISPDEIAHATAVLEAIMISAETGATTEIDVM